MNYQRLTGTVRLVGAAGIEPANAGTKNRCLTTWLRPIHGALAGAAIMPANRRHSQAFTRSVRGPATAMPRDSVNDAALARYYAMHSVFIAPHHYSTI